MMTEYMGYNIKGDGTYGYQKITRKGSGPVPKALSGMYTSLSEARKAIDMHGPAKEKKSDAKAEGSTGI